MIKAVIFDLNGVLIKAPYCSERLSEKFSIPKDKVLKALREVMSEVRKKNAPSLFSVWKPHFDRWNLDMKEKELLDFAFCKEKEDKGMIDLVKSLKKRGIKVFILSNGFKERTNYYEKNFPFLKLFDRIYYSHRTGFIKPDERAYQNLLNENGIKAEDCIYFDDLEKNIEVAESLGIKSYQYKGTDKTKTIINNLLN